MFHMLGEEVVHRTVHTKGAVEFAYSEDDLCRHTVSDHNYYSMCYVSNIRYALQNESEILLNDSNFTGDLFLTVPFYWVGKKVISVF